MAPIANGYESDADRDRKARERAKSAVAALLDDVETGQQQHLSQSEYAFMPEAAFERPAALSGLIFEELLRAVPFAKAASTDAELSLKRDVERLERSIKDLENKRRVFRLVRLSAIHAMELGETGESFAVDSVAQKAARLHSRALDLSNKQELT